MIFLTVGTLHFQFRRLIQKMDEIAGKIDEKVVMQIGYTDYEPENAEWFKFKEINDIKEYYKKADIIVAHAGAGTLLDALSFRKFVIAVPRRKKYDEHIDDQQLELTEVLSKTGKVLAVYDIIDLDFALETAKKTENITFQIDQGLSRYLESYLRGNPS